MASHSTDQTQIAQPYATALFALAEENNALDLVAGELAQWAELAVSHAEFSALAANPTISSAQKAAIVADINKGAKASPLIQKLLHRLALNGRLATLPSLYRLYMEKLALARGELHVTITSAKDLSAAQQKALSASLAKATGKTIVPHLLVDPALLGGLVIRAGSRLLDYSLQGRLRQMALALQPNHLNRH